MDATSLACFQLTVEKAEFIIWWNITSYWPIYHETIQAGQRHINTVHSLALKQDTHLAWKDFVTGDAVAVVFLCFVPAATNTPLWFGQPTLSLLPLRLTTWWGKFTSTLPVLCVSVIVPSLVAVYIPPWLPSGGVVAVPKFLLQAVHHHLHVKLTL